MHGHPVFQFSSDAVPVRERLAVWREVIGKKHMSLEVEPEDAESFRATITVRYLPWLPVTHLHTTPMKYTRTREHAQKDDSNFTFVCVPRGSFEFDGEGETGTFAAGDAALLPNNRTGTILSASGEPVTCFHVNGATIRGAFPQIDERLMHRLDGGSTTMKLVRRYLDTLLAAEPVTPALGLMANGHIADLLTLALRPSNDARERAQASAVPAARLAAMRSDVFANLADPELSAASLAWRHGVSERYVHLLFEQNAQSFNRFVTNERLKRAMAMLLDPALASMRVSDIAFAVGFGDLTTFNRAFRRVYGDTPRAVRTARRS